MRLQYWLFSLLALCVVVLSFSPPVDTCEEAREMVKIWEDDPRPEAERDGWPPEVLEDMSCS